MNVELATEALEDLRWFRKHEQVLIQAGIAKHLKHQPDVETKKRKRLHPGHIAEWELRLGGIRVFYDVDSEAGLVSVRGVGYKERNRLFFRGVEHQP